MGFVVFLFLLLFSVQLLFNLYAASVVSAVTYDAATRVAREGGAPPARADAEQAARTLLGGYGEVARFDWSGTDADTVVLRVQVVAPSLVPRALGGVAPFGDLDRTVRVRVEAFR